MRPDLRAAAAVLAGVGIVVALVAAAGRVPFYAPALGAVAVAGLVSVAASFALVRLAREVTAERVALALHLGVYAWTWLLTVAGEPRRRLARHRAASTTAPGKPG